MKKLLLILPVLLLVGALVYVLLFMPETPAIDAKLAAEQTPSSTAVEEKNPNLDVKKNAETPADVLESLGYENSKNPDTVGWLQIPGTEINNSVLQGPDNVKYLRTNERGQEDLYGCYFVDYTCSIGARSEFSPNTVIYGHSDLKDNPNGPRFSQLFRFADPTFARETPYLYFSTQEEFMDWQVFAVYYTDIAMDYIKTDLSGTERVALADAAMEKSLYDYGVDVGAEDKILTLSTCTVKYGAEDKKHRFVVMAKLLPDGWDNSQPVEIIVKEPKE